MKNIKKILISLILIGLISSTSVFADPDPGLLDSATQEARVSAFMPTSSHRMAMGSAGLGLAGFYDSYLYNPANISKDGFKFVLPSITLTVNNVYNLMEPDSGENVVELAQQVGDSDEAAIDLATLFLKSIPFGYGEILTLDANTGFKTRNFGLDLAVQEKLRSYNGGSDYTTASAISETSVALTAAIGFNVPLVSDYITLDLGASAAFNYKMYSLAIDANEILNLFNHMDEGADLILENIPFASGYAVPVTVGANLNLPLGFTISGVGRNFNGNYNMVAYSNLKSLINNDETIVAFIGEDTFDDEESEVTISDEFSVEVPWTLDLGVAFAPSTPLDGVLKAQLALDFIDCYSLIEDAIKETKTATQLKSDALESINIGAQVRLLNLLDVRGGFSQGYKSIGLGLDLLVLHLDASYYWKEYGEVLGQSPSDALSVKFSLISR
ncbi:MAG: hypothetical protein ACPKM0_03485 [Pleomorphochaeta sp.]